MSVFQLTGIALEAPATASAQQPHAPDGRAAAGMGGAGLESERPYLLRVALLRLRDRHLAEDAVQETLVAALRALPDFGARSSLRTWLVAILRNKINDLLACRGRWVLACELAGDAGDDAAAEQFFDDAGHWSQAMAAGSWGRPEPAMQQREFWQIFQRCLDELPPRSAEVFQARELLGESVAEICARLGISESNCAVLLHRARLRLRASLEQRWFAGKREPADAQFA